MNSVDSCIRAYPRKRNASVTAAVYYATAVGEIGEDMHKRLKYQRNDSNYKGEMFSYKTYPLKNVCSSEFDN